MKKLVMFLLNLLMIGAILLLVYYFARPLMNDPGNGRYQKIPSEAEYSLMREETITVDRVPIDYTFQTYYPPELPKEGEENSGSIQHIEDIDIRPPPDTPVKTGERLLWEREDHLGTDIITIVYKVKSKTVKWDLDEKKSGSLDDITRDPIRGTYLGDQWAQDENGDGEPEDRNRDGSPDAFKIEPSNPEIASTARSIVGTENNVYGIVLEIYRYMTGEGSFTYSLGREGTPARAVETLMSRRGDCDDQSILFISLLRSVGIPAWLELGVLYDESANQWYGHGWTNVYIPLRDGGYEVVTVDVVNEQFLFRTCNHLTEWTDDGVKGYYSGNEWVKSHLAKYYFFFQYQYRSQGRPRVSHTEEFKTLSYTSSGTVLYEVESGDTFWKEEIPFLPLPTLLLGIIGIAGAFRIFGRRNKMG